MMSPERREIRPSSDSNYTRAKYLSPGRMSSIGWQFALCEETGAQTFLEVGAGSQLLAFLLGRQGKRVFTADPYPVVEPNLLAALPTLPLADRSVDACVCFQTLEHLPLDRLPACLAELARVSRLWIIISLPDRTVKTNKELRIKYAFYRLFHAPSNWHPPTIPPVHPQHYWELGHDGVGYDVVVSAAHQSGLELVRQFTNRLNTYHRFFLFRRADSPVSPS